MDASGIKSKAERSRDAIIAAAEPIFAERGYAGASLNEIIAASGLTKGGIYFHFSSKRDLALAVIAENQRRWFEHAMAEAGRHARAVDRLFAVPRVLARLSRQGEGPAALRRLVDELASVPELRPQVCGPLDLAVRMTAGQFREAQAEGAIRPDLDADALAEVAVGGFVGLQTLTEQLADDGLERRVEELIHVVQLATLSRP